MSPFRDEMPDRPTVQLCDDHEGVELIPGPFCPMCAYTRAFRDGQENWKAHVEAARVLGMKRPALDGATDNCHTEAERAICNDAIRDEAARANAAKDARTATARVASLRAERDALAALLKALVAAADAINEGFDPFTSMNCVCSEEAQERCASPVAPEDAPCSTCRHRKVKLQADAARAALARIDAASGGGK